MSYHWRRALIRFNVLSSYITSWSNACSALDIGLLGRTTFWLYPARHSRYADRLLLVHDFFDCTNWFSSSCICRWWVVTFIRYLRINLPSIFRFIADVDSLRTRGLFPMVCRFALGNSQNTQEDDAQLNPALQRTPPPQILHVVLNPLPFAVQKALDGFCEGGVG